MDLRIARGSDSIPGFRLIERLGSGSFGEVWIAESVSGERKAIKIIYGDLQLADADDTRRLMQIFRALNRLLSVRLPYLLALEHYEIVSNRLVIVMELADRNLWDRCRECQSKG